MKDLKQLLKKKTVGARSTLDEKSILVVFTQIIREEYGKQGAKNITPVLVNNKKITVKAANSNWANELLCSKSQLLNRIQEQLGGEEVMDITLVR